MTEGVERLRRMIKESDRRLQLTRDRLDSSPETIAHLVQTALDLAGQPALVPATEPGLYALPGGGGVVGLSPEWTDSIPELIDRMDGTRRLVTFEPEKAAPAPGPILLHLNHPFVAHAAALLRVAGLDPDHDRPAQPRHRAHLRPCRGPRGHRGSRRPGGGRPCSCPRHRRHPHRRGRRTKVLHEDVVAQSRAVQRNGRWAQLRTDKATDALYAARTERSRPTTPMRRSNSGPASRRTSLPTSPLGRRCRQQPRRCAQAQSGTGDEGPP